MDAVEAVAALPGVERIRLGSLDPDEVDGAFIRRAAAEQKLCHHFHLSLQSGCDAVLHRMNRRYTTGEFRAGGGRYPGRHAGCRHHHRRAVWVCGGDRGGASGHLPIPSGGGLFQASCIPLLQTGRHRGCRSGRDIYPGR